MKKVTEKNAPASTALKSKTKTDPMPLNMEKCIQTFDQNQTQSLNLMNEGRRLLCRITGEGIDEGMMAQLTEYVNGCNSARTEMHERRRPFTNLLTAMQKKFVAEENAINPQQAGSPAAEINLHMRSFLQARMDAAAAEEQRLQRNRSNFERRILGRADLDDEQKELALQRADTRLVNGQKSLKEQAVKTSLQPCIIATDGYAEIFRFWWEEAGKGLPDEDLQRYLHPMISFARKQAAKGVRINAAGVVYKEIPMV